MADTAKKPERMKLTILEVKPRQVINAERGTTKLAFKAHNGEGEHWFYTFRSSLFETIEDGKDKTLDADVLTTESEQWGTQRDVKQLYVDNEPVAGKKQWQGRQDSPETRVSIESQKRADIISQLWIAEKLKEDNPLIGKLLSWLHKLEGNQTSPLTKVIKQPEQDIDELWLEDKSPEAKPVKETKDFINLEWLEESLKTLRAKKLQAWTESKLLSYMKTSYKVEADTVLEAASKLEKGQATHFVKKVQETLDMA